MLKAGLATQTEGATAAGPHGTKVVQPPPAPAEIAALFPHLEILECLGRGGMGVVYKARQPRLNRYVALKILAREKEQDAQFAERFTREAQALARLNHPNIVTVHDFGTVEQASSPPLSEGQSEKSETGKLPVLHYLLMEFVDGLNLRQLLQARKMPSDQALMIVPKICEALQYAHEQGVVHRDIKPENILLDKSGRVKIADFGIAKMLGDEPGQQTLTGAKEAVGTPHYMAPEQIEKPLSVDHRADIYSLGVVFYEMLTGELPLGKFQPPSSKVQIDVRLDEVVLHALEKEPERRYQQASQVRTAVETIAATLPGGSPSNQNIPVQTAAEIEAVRKRLKIPARGLIASAVLQLLFALGLLIFAVPGVARESGGLIGVAVIGFIVVGFLIPTAVVLAGVTNMLKLRRYTFTVVASVVAAVAGPGAILGLPFGIWACVELFRPEVRAAFASNRVPTGFAATSDSGKMNLARSQVKRPAIGLAITGALNWAVFTLVLVVSKLKPAGSMVPAAVVNTPIALLLVCLLAMALSGFIIYGALKVMRLERWSAGVAGGILAMIVAPSNILGLPIGIWALVVLNRREVRAAFEANRQADDKRTSLPVENQEPPPAIPMSAVESWLAQMDDGNYAGSWETAAPYFQRAMAKEEWIGRLKKVRYPLGQVISRKFASSQFSVSGTRLVLKFAAAFDGLLAATETVTFARQAGGEWRAIGYLVRPAEDKKSKPDHFWRFIVIVFLVIPTLGVLSSIALQNFLKTGGNPQPAFKSDYVGQAWFPEGDSIELTSVERTPEHMTVRGHYNLVSHDGAKLAFYVTTTNKNVPGGNGEERPISKGRGDFTLFYLPPISGLPHVSMYSADGHCFASLYFGSQAEALEESKAGWITNASSASTLQFRLVLPTDSTEPADWLSSVSSRERLQLSRQVLLDDTAIAQAGVDFDPFGVRMIEIRFTDAGAKQFEAITATNIGHQLAIVFRGRVLSAPVIQSVIPGGECQVTGLTNASNVNSIVDYLNRTTTPTAEAWKFSMPHERVLPFKPFPSACYGWLDLDSGMILTNSSVDWVTRIGYEWLRTNGLDVVASESSKHYPTLIGFDLAIAPAPTNGWDIVTTADVANNWALLRDEPRQKQVFGALPGQSDTFFFQTREAGKGILQILGVTDNPRGVKVRYKLVQATQPGEIIDPATGLPTVRGNTNLNPNTGLPLPAGATNTAIDSVTGLPMSPGESGAIDPVTGLPVTPAATKGR